MRQRRDARLDGRALPGFLPQVQGTAARADARADAGRRALTALVVNHNVCYTSRRFASGLERQLGAVTPPQAHDTRINPRTAATPK